jgi:hypothetical protein
MDRGCLKRTGCRIGFAVRELMRTPFNSPEKRSLGSRRDMLKPPLISLFTILFVLVASSSPAYAHFFLPIPNYFSKENIGFAVISTIVLIIIQSLLLKWLIREIPYVGSLWRAALVNTVLGVAVSLLLPNQGLDPITMLFYFAACAIPSAPFLFFLYRHARISWISSFRLGLVVNLMSYVALFFLYLVAGGVQWGAEVLLDRYQVSKWNDSALLRPSSGRIYATYFRKFDYRFSWFDTKSLAWKEISHINDIDGFRWDVEGDNLAYVIGSYGYSNDNQKLLKILSLSGNGQSHEISLSDFVKLQPAPDEKFHYLKISPDKKKLAVFLRLGYIQGYKDSGGFSVLGGKCKLFIMDITTRTIITSAPRWAADFGPPCWLPDSGSVLFHSYRDERLYEGDLHDSERGKVYKHEDTMNPRFAAGLYKFDLADGSITWFGEGKNPRLDITNNSIVTPVAEGFRDFDLGTKRETITQIQGLVAWTPIIPSPNGKLLLCFMKGHSRELLPVVLDRKEPNRRFAIVNNMAESWAGELSWSSSAN